MKLLRRVAVPFALVVAMSAYAADSVPQLPVLPLPPVVVTGGAAVAAVPLAHVHNGSFDLRFVNVGQLVDLLYDDAMHVPHVISSDVLQDQRVVSFQYDSHNGDLHDFVKVFLDSLGFQVQSKDGVDFVGRKDVSGDLSEIRATFVYHPRYRSATYLAKLVQPLFSGRIGTSADTGAQPMLQGRASGAVFGGLLGASQTNAGVSAGEIGPTGAPMSAGLSEGASGTPMSSQSSVSVADDLVFYGRPAEIKSLKAVLPDLDTPPGEVVVRGWVYEVSDTDQKNSAFSIAAHLLDGQLGISNGAASNDATALTFDAHFLNVAISALHADTRFKEVSDPHVRVLSGQKVSLNVGSQVPTLGSISYQGTSGTPVQSVVYQDAGVIFAVRPTVMADSIQLDLDEQISSFVPTLTGVNSSPTKNTREMSTTVSMKDGEVVVLGGLVQDADTVAVNHEGWLPHFLDGRSSSKARTEVLLVLQVMRVVRL